MTNDTKIAIVTAREELLAAAEYLEACLSPGANINAFLPSAGWRAKAALRYMATASNEEFYESHPAEEMEIEDFANEGEGSEMDEPLSEDEKDMLLLSYVS